MTSTRGRRSDLPPSRERDCAERGGHGQAFRALLAARRASDRQRREDVEVAGQFLYAARPVSQGLQAFGHPIFVGLCPLPPAFELHL